MEKHSKIKWSLTKLEMEYYVPTAMYLNKNGDPIVWLLNAALHGRKLAQSALKEMKVGCDFSAKEWHRLETKEEE